MGSRAIGDVSRHVCFPLTVMLAVCAVLRIQAAELRDADVFYLAEWKQSPLQLKALGRAPMYLSPSKKRPAAYLAKGQSVKLIAVGQSMDYVEAQTGTGPVKGWVDAAALEPPPAELLNAVHKRRERAVEYRELIARHEVALGMTTEEVQESLGKPRRRLRVRSPDGPQEQWFYETYRYTPTYREGTDEKGNPSRVVSYARTVAGHKVVTFSGKEVVGVSDRVGNEPGVPASALPPVPTNQGK